MTEWIDVHTHLNMLEDSPEEVLRRAEAVGVKRVINIGTEPKDHDIVFATAKKYYPRVFCTLGVHPHEAKVYSDEVEQSIREKLNEKEVVAVGEIGLDYYYEHSDREVQREAFRRQLALAAESNLPVEIHTRDAEPDTVEILQEFKGKVTGLIHCFTGTQWLADECLKLGFHISISGVATFKNAKALRAVVESIPLDKIHVETDAPFLAPVPQRGKKNEPGFVIHVADLVAELHNLSLEELSEHTRRNAATLFTKLKAVS